MLYLYDDALVMHIENLTRNQISVINTPVDKFFERYEKSSGTNKIILPAISISRKTMRPSMPAALHQLRVAQDWVPVDENTDRDIFMLDMPLEYDINLWSKSIKGRDNMLKDFLYLIIRNPHIYIPDALIYNKNPKTDVIHKFELQIGVPNDTSDISNIEQTGELFRITLPVTIIDSKLFYYEDVVISEGVDLKLSWLGVDKFDAPEKEQEEEYDENTIEIDLENVDESKT